MIYLMRHGADSPIGAAAGARTSALPYPAQDGPAEKERAYTAQKSRPRSGTAFFAVFYRKLEMP